MKYTHIDSKEQSTTFNSIGFEKMDYGEKLAVNHNMLKELLQVVDSKILEKKLQQSRRSREKNEENRES